MTAISKKEKLTIGLKGKFSEIKELPTLKTMAEDTIKNLIMDHILEPGEIYNEALLSSELGISKTPVREALLELSSKGFISIIRRKGFKVNVINKKNILDLFSYRILLEAEVVSKTAESISDTDIKALKTSIRKMKMVAKVKDKKKYLVADRDFHSTFATIYDNPYITKSLNESRDLLDWMVSKVLIRELRMQETIEEHEKIINAIEMHDAQKAKQAIIEHLEITFELVISHI